MNKVQHTSAAEMQCFLDLIVAKASELKSQIENVQCMAIDARLTLMSHDANSDGMRQVRQRIAYELGSITGEIERLVAESCAALVTTEHRTLQ